MNAALYVRVSTQQQAKEGYSIETQIEACKKKAEEMGATSIKIYKDDGWSGAYLDRPKLDELRDAVATGVHDLVIIYEADRLSRDTMHLLLLTEEIEKNAQLVYVNTEYSRTPEGQLFYEIRGSFAKYERIKMRDRFQRGKRGKLRKGLPISDHGIYGYDWDGQNYVINEHEAEIVRKIFDKYINTLGGYRAVIDWLAEEGIPSPKGLPRWSDFGMQKILHRQMYTGEYYAYTVYNKKVSAKKFDRKPRDKSEWIPMTCPAIISKEVFEQAQNKIKRNTQQRIRETKHISLLSGVIYCGSCGRKMQSCFNSRTKNGYSYYQCYSVARGVKGCTNHNVSSEVVDKTVWEILRRVCRNESALNEYINENQPTKKDNAAQVKKELKSIEGKRNAIMNWFSANLITAEETTSKLEALKKQEMLLQEKLNTKKEHIPTEQIVKDVKGKITFEEKRNFILQHIEKVIVLRKDFADPNDIDLEISIIFRS